MLPTEIHRGNRLATVTHLMADGDARLAIDDFLLTRELLRGRSSARRAFPAGQLFVARLRIEMAMPVESVNANSLALVAKVLQIVAVGGIAGCDEALALGQFLRLIDKLSLLEGADGNLTLTATLVQDSLSTRQLPRSAHFGTILIDSSRRNPNSACRRRDIWMKTSRICSSLSKSSSFALETLVTYTRSGMA